jgi:hypothetical protein
MHGLTRRLLPPPKPPRKRSEIDTELPKDESKRSVLRGD